jgi:hypothetical protein
MEWAKKLNFGRRSAIGNFLEPAFTSANIVLQTILGPPFAWYWNRVVTGFVCVAGQQDYYVVNWQASTVYATGTFTVDNNGNSQQVTVGGTSNTSAPTWNNTPSGTTTDGSVTWNNLGRILGSTPNARAIPVSQTYNLGFVENASVLDITATPSPKWFQISNMTDLARDSSQARPRFISVQADDGNGNVTFRLTPAPNAAYPVMVTLQQKPQSFTSVNQTWAPIPDEYQRIYTWGFLALMWSFADDPRFQLANQKFVSQLLSTAEGLDETKKNIFLMGWQAIVGQPVENAARMQQGGAARGM